jgi:hypothetical protein
LIENFRDLKSCFQNIEKLCEDFTFKKTENPQRKKLIAARNVIQGVILKLTSSLIVVITVISCRNLRMTDDFKNDTEALPVTDFLFG